MQWQRVIWPTVIFLDDKNATPVSNLAMPTFKQKDHTTIFFATGNFIFFFALLCPLPSASPLTSASLMERWDEFVGLRLIHSLAGLNSLVTANFRFVSFIPLFPHHAICILVCTYHVQRNARVPDLPLTARKLARTWRYSCQQTNWNGKNRLCDQTCKSLESIVGWRFCCSKTQCVNNARLTNSTS